MKIKNALITILGILFCIYAITLMFSMFNAGTILTFIVGVIFIIIGQFWNKLPKKPIFKIFKSCICLFIGFMTAMISFIIISRCPVYTDFKEDAVIVLGSGLNGENVSKTLELRLNACIQYIKKNPNALIIVSGGQGSNEAVTEAFAMHKYLVKNGVPDEKIILEERSTSTYENFAYSKEILDNIFKEPYKTVFITNRFHCYRAFNLAENANITSSCYEASDEITTAIPSYLRETLAIVKLWIFKI